MFLINDYLDPKKIIALTIAGVVCNVLKEFLSDDSEVIENARKEGHENGLMQGYAESKKEYLSRLQNALKQSDFIIAATALSSVVAYADGNLSAEESDEFQHFAGAIQQHAYSQEVKDFVYNLLHNKNLSFLDIKQYLKNLNNEQMDVLNTLVHNIAGADDIITQEEENVIQQWDEYHRVNSERGV